MKMIQKLIFSPFLLFSCSPENGTNNLASFSESELKENEANGFQKEMNQLAQVGTENGKIESISGLTFSKGLATTNDDSLTNLKKQGGNSELFASDEPIFDFELPPDISPSFSPPIMVSAASLMLNKSDELCQLSIYNNNPPSFREVAEFSKENDLCGTIKLKFCFRLTKKSKLGSDELVSFLESPATTISIPCQDDSFNQLTLMINDDQESTKSKQVKISFNASDAITQIYLTNSNSCLDSGVWADMKTSFTWNLGDLPANGSNEYQVYARFRDIFGQESACMSDRISYSPVNFTSTTNHVETTETDSNTISGASISIDGGTTTNNANPNLTLSAIGASQMYVTNSAGCSDGGTWEAFAISKPSWGLSSQNTTTSVYVKYLDTDNNESSCVSDSIIHDDQVPSSTSIQVGTNEETNDGSPDLTLAATGASQMYITNTTGCSSGGTWEPYMSSKASWGLAQLNQVATVYVRFKDEANNISVCISDSTTHDNTAPSAISVTIGSGDYTSLSSPLVFLSAVGANEFYLSNTPGCASGGAWETYATVRSGWALAQANATATVYVAFRDNLENTSACTSDTIIHDNVVPSTPTSLNDGTLSTSATESPSISWNASTDANSGILGYELSIGTSAGATDVKDWADVGNVTTRSLSGLSLAPATTYYTNLRAVDQAENKSPHTSSNGFQYEIPGYAQEAYVKPTKTQENYEFAQSVAIDGDTMVIGAPFDNDGAAGVTNGTGTSSGGTMSQAGAAYVYKRSGSTWEQEAYLKASNSDSYDRFGNAVAISGDTIVIGAQDESSSDTGVQNGSLGGDNNAREDSGAVYVFKRTGTTWAQEAFVKSPNPDNGDNFGQSVAISADTIIVGSTGESSNLEGPFNGTTASTNNSSLFSGAAYIFKRTGVNWVQEAFLKAAANDPEDSFGRTVGIDGDTAVVGADEEDSPLTGVANGTTGGTTNGSSNAGAAFVFKRTGSTWVQEAYLKSSNSEAHDKFGTSVAISGDTIVVGANGEDSDATGPDHSGTPNSDNSSSGSGAAYVFKRSGTSWSEEAYLKAANTDSDDKFGQTVGISGEFIVIGAIDEQSNETGVSNGTGASSNNALSAAGAACVFERSGSTWTQKSYLKAANTDAEDKFGSSLAISADSIVIGAPFEDSITTGITQGTSASSNNSQATAGAAYIMKK